MIPLCILAIADDDDRSFMSELYLKYHRLMYHEIFALVQNQWMAEDLMQTTLVKLIDRIPDLRKMEQDHLAHYIVSACKNQSRNYLRDSTRHEMVSISDYLDDTGFSSQGDSIEFYIIKNEELEEFSHIWPLLDVRTRYLLEGRYILGLSYEEMARVLGIKTGSVRMALTRARNSAYQILISKEEKQ